MSCTGNICTYYDGKKCIFTGENATGSRVYCPLPEMIENHDPRLNTEPPVATSKPDMVNHPFHYTQGGIECIEAIRASMTPEAFQGYCKGNVMKYIWRASLKNGVEDLKKAQVYLGWMIESMEKANE